MVAFKINNTKVSNRSWSSVDKTVLRNRLVKGLRDNEAGAAAAVREVYAVIKSDNLEDAPSSNWWGPHHEVSQDGTVILNRNGLAAAAAALAGARAQPNLSPEQKRRASRHLLRHYRQIGDDPPDGISEALMEMAGITSLEELDDSSTEAASTSYPVDVGVAPRDAEVFEAIHVILTRNKTFYQEKAIREALETWVSPYPKPVIKNHDINEEPVGRVVGAAVTRSVLKPEYTTARLYVDISDPEAKQKFKDGRYRTTSIGCTVDSVKCSICGSDILKEDFCGHMKGRVYDGKECYWIIESIVSFDEISVVNVPSDPLSMRITDLVAKGEVKEGMDLPNKLDEAEIEKTLEAIDSLLGQEGAEVEEPEVPDTPEGEENVVDNPQDSPDEQSTESTEPQSGEDKPTVEELQEQLQAAQAELQAREKELAEAKEQITVLEAANTALSAEIEELKRQLEDREKAVAEATRQNLELAKLAQMAYREHAVTLAVFGGEAASREEAEQKFAGKKIKELREYCQEAIKMAPQRAEQNVNAPAPTTAPENPAEGKESGYKKPETLADFEEILLTFLTRKK